MEKLTIALVILGVLGAVITTLTAFIKELKEAYNAQKKAITYFIEAQKDGLDDKEKKEFIRLANKGAKETAEAWEEGRKLWKLIKKQILKKNKKI